MPVVTASDGVDIAYEEAGSGDPVVLLAGTAVDHTVFRAGEQFNTFASAFRVIGMDYRGTGRSTRPTSGYTANDLAGDVVALLDALGLQRAALVGVSMGSLIAQRVAASNPSRVSGLALWNTWAHTDEYLRRQFEIWRYLYANADPVFVGQASLYWLLSREFLADQPQAVDQIAEDVFAGPDAASRQDSVRHIDVLLSHDNRERLAAIECPTLVVTGEHDRSIPPDYAPAVAERIADARLETLSGAGASHALFLERSSEVNEFTLAFLRRL